MRGKIKIEKIILLVCFVLIFIFHTKKIFAAKVVDKNEISNYVVGQKDKIILANGDVMDMTGTIYHADGTQTLPNGAIKDIYGIIHYADGTIKLPDGTTYYINGTVEHNTSVDTNESNNVETNNGLTKGAWEYEPLSNSWRFKYRVPRGVAKVYKNEWIVTLNSQGEEAWYAVNEVGDMVIGWLKYNGGYYYMSQKPSSRGELVKGEVSIEGKVCKFDLNTGKLIEGDKPRMGYEIIGAVNHKTGRDGAWKRYETGERYFAVFYDLGNGQKMDVTPKEWYMVDGDYYYFDEWGIPKTGLIIYDGKYYYLNEDGKMQEGGKVVIDNTEYTFDEATGACTEMHII